MATSDTDICNIALGYLGGNRIIDLTDNTSEAIACKLHYVPARNATLEDVNWSFAIKRYVVGATLADPPAYGFSNAFELAPEVLRVIDVNDNMIEWQREGWMIVCDCSSINYRAVVEIDNPAKFSPGFVLAFAARLAAEIALPLTNSVSQFDRMWQVYAMQKKAAQANDGRQGKAPKKMMTEKFRR